MDISPNLIKLLQQANRIAVLTGAGVSAESGVPTFRQAQTGLWAQYDPQELATPQAFQQNPRLVWEWYAWRRDLVMQAQPNPGHLALAEIERHVPQFTLITQNVDGLHQRAGSQNVIELHGNILRTKCFDNEHIIAQWADTDEVPPHCPQCDSLLRPDVVWFGEGIPYITVIEAISIARSCDLFLAIGTSAIVQPAASLPLEAAQRHIPTIEINPQTTPISRYMDFALSGPSGEVLPALAQAAWG
jgi:NAD-dependent deacetylase